MACYTGAGPRVPVSSLPAGGTPEQLERYAAAPTQGIPRIAIAAAGPAFALGGVDMNCPSCGTEMRSGWLAVHTTLWGFFLGASGPQHCYFRPDHSTEEDVV